MKRLKQIVCIRSGYTMRKPPRGIVPGCPYPMIQVKDIARIVDSFRKRKAIQRS